MRFKLDENLGPRFVALFAQAGHDVDTVHDEGIAGASDVDVYRAAIADGRTLVTLDLDFASPLRFPTRGTPGIIVVRVRRPVLAAIVQTLRRALEHLVRENVADKLWIVEPGRIREHSSDDDHP